MLKTKPRRGQDWRGKLTHCKRGHPLSGENLYVCTRGGRHCRTCRRDRTRKWRGKPPFSPIDVYEIPVEPVAQLIELYILEMGPIYSPCGTEEVWTDRMHSGGLGRGSVLAGEADIGVRLVRSILNHERKTVPFHIVDQLICAMDMVGEWYEGGVLAEWYLTAEGTPPLKKAVGRVT